ncbi:hypothetical protein [Trujillonella endophytica]|uniref:Uncharacterized conserved protein n=1 Tax=Trujillonella endophytica TaxID=673521 RepID=A0A1H8TYQ3_9ACTN|nr:hypothetical protein [Trujillella endophytica]SEO96027.1 Uncharacterized conserved protein [Trujillella endophytica]
MAPVWTIVALVVLGLLVAWTAWTLSRLRRLEGRVDRARTALETQLRRRAALAAEVAGRYATALEPERAARLTRAAAGARLPWTPDRELAENVLGRELRGLPRDVPGLEPALAADLAGTAQRVALARRFYNDAVRDTRELRGRRFARVLRLHARRPLPRYFDIDDSYGELAGTAGTGGS